MDNHSIIFFINDMLKLKTKQEIDEFCLNETKRMKKLNKLTEDITLDEINKKLFMQLMGYRINIIDFIKAIPNSLLKIRRNACLGFLNGKNYKKVILLHSIMFKSIKEKSFVIDFLDILGNSIKPDTNFVDLIYELEKNHQLDTKTTLLFQFDKKLLICKTKYTQQIIQLKHNTNENLFIKLQLIQKYNITISKDDVLYLRQQIYHQNSFLLYKTIQILNKIICTTPVIIQTIVCDNNLIDYLESKIIKSTEKTKKQIDIALSLEIARFLIKINNSFISIKSFINRLLISKNENSRIMGIDFALKNNILKNESINCCILYLTTNRFYKQKLLSFINKKNCDHIYRQLADHMDCKSVIKKIYIKTTNIAIKSDILYKLPEIFSKVYRKHDLININNFINSDNIYYFPIIYYNGKKLSDEKILIMIQHHLKILLQNIFIHDYYLVLMELFTFITTHGNLKQNREILLKYQYIKEIIPGILLFNFVLPDKIIYINNTLIFYHLRPGILEIQHCSVFDDQTQLQPISNNYYDISHRNGSIYIEYNNIRQLLLK